MQLFIPVGPFVIPSEKRAAAKVIKRTALADFWEMCGIAERRGCYIFGMRTGRGVLPFYVGQAKKTFKQEVFTPHKTTYYQECLADHLRGLPVLLFLVSPNGRGRPNTAAINACEQHLIQLAIARNPDLLNVQGTELADWGISGVLRGGRGKPGAGARALKRMLGIER